MAKDQSNKSKPDEHTANAGTTTNASAKDGASESTYEANTGQVELLSKIVAKNLVKRSALNYKKDDEGNVINGEPRLLYRIFGTARTIRRGESTYGAWTAFEGSFEAVRFSDHQRFQAPECFLQGAAEGLLEDALITLQKEDPTGTLQFAFDIGVKPSPKWEAEDKGNSYEYTVKTVFESAQHDPLKELREKAMKSLPRLAGPST